MSPRWTAFWLVACLVFVPTLIIMLPEPPAMQAQTPIAEARWRVTDTQSMGAARSEEMVTLTDTWTGKCYAMFHTYHHGSMTSTVLGEVPCQKK